MPGQTTIVAAVWGRVTRGKAALTLVEPPGLRGTTAGHGTDSTPDREEVNR